MGNHRRSPAGTPIQSHSLNDVAGQGLRRGSPMVDKSIRPGDSIASVRPWVPPKALLHYSTVYDAAQPQRVVLVRL